MVTTSPFNVLPLRRLDQEDLPDPIAIELGDEGETAPTMDGSARITENPDGSATVELDARDDDGPPPDKHFANLAEHLDTLKLAAIASDLLDAIERDDQSRQDWLTTHATGIDMLGLKIDETSGSADSSAPLEGMSTIRHPLLLEATLAFQATARGELLPPGGPVKVRDDRPEKSDQVDQPVLMMGHNGAPSLAGPSPFMPPGGSGAAPVVPPMAGGAVAAPPTPPAAVAPPVSPPQGAPPVGASPLPGAGSSPPPLGAAPPPMPPEDTDSDRDELAEALQKDFNHYLTATAKEYYPDTDRMFFTTGFGGQGIKKVYNCPLRRRPVSESVPVEDFIVSNALTDLGNAARITHRSKVRPSFLKRMQIKKAWRDVPLGNPVENDSPNAVDQSKAQVVGVEPSNSDPRDADYTILECYCELVLDEFAPKQFKGKELPLPYRVTIEKDSRIVLEIRRNWREDDQQCMAIEYFVEFPFVKAFGFYGIGLLHILGNTTKALTAAWREFIDSGMFSNFPGFLFNKGVGRQNTNTFRVAPGQGVPMDMGVSGSLKDNVVPLPYKDLGPAFASFVEHMEETGQRLGGTAQIAVAQMKPDAPVGTTLALIEQAMKPMSAVLQRLHSAQGKEFQLLKDRFRDDPAAFWRFNAAPTMKWQKEQFLKALDDYDLVPVSDPNNPTALHRMAKAEAFKNIVAAAPQFFDQKKALGIYGRELNLPGIDEAMIPGQPAAPQPQVDPAKMAEAQAKHAKAQADLAAKAQDNRTELEIKRLELQDSAADRASAEAVALINQATEKLRLAQTMAIHSDKMNEAKQTLGLKLASDHLSQAMEQFHQHTLAHAKANAQHPAPTLAPDQSQPIQDGAMP